MEIRRKVELTVTTNRRYIIRRSASSGSAECEVCGKPMLTAEPSAKFFDISQRYLFQMIETGALHYAETETNEVRICITSLAEFLSDGKRKDYVDISNQL
jgi:hypothetical protein